MWLLELFRFKKENPVIAVNEQTYLIHKKIVDEYERGIIFQSIYESSKDIVNRYELQKSASRIEFPFPVDLMLHQSPLKEEIIKRELQMNVGRLIRINKLEKEIKELGIKLNELCQHQKETNITK